MPAPRKIKAPKAVAAAKIAAELGVSHARGEQLVAEGADIQRLRAVKLAAEIEKLDLANATSRGEYVSKAEEYERGLSLAAAVNAILESLSSTLPGVLEGLPAAAMPPIIKAEVHKVGALMSKAASKLKGED
tara:strand:+ start:75 stop:470 length:396 start_codon:yes stop_codon:yes gene_type:complete